MIVRGKETCPTCGQAVNWRQINLTKQLVSALFQVYLLCKRTGKHVFQRKELDPVLNKGTQYANFGYWRWFSEGMIYAPIFEDGKTRGKGWWAFNIERMEKFFKDEIAVYSVIYTRKKGDARENDYGPKIFMSQVPDITVFMEGNQDYADFVVTYKNQPKPEQQKLVD